MITLYHSPQTRSASIVGARASFDVAINFESAAAEAVWQNACD